MTQVNMAEAAKLFGASERGVREWVRAGMPHALKLIKKGGSKKRIMVEVEAARNWLVEKGSRTFIKAEVKPAPVESAAPVTAPVPKMNVEPGVDGAVERLRQIELRAFSDYVRARNAGDVHSQRAHMKLHSEAVRRMLEAEGVIDEHKKLEAEVWGRMNAALTAWADAVKSMVEQMPRALASRCNVNDPATAEKALRDWVDAQLYPIMGRDPRA